MEQAAEGLAKKERRFALKSRRVMSWCSCSPMACHVVCRRQNPCVWRRQMLPPAAAPASCHGIFQVTERASLPHGSSSALWRVMSCCHGHRDFLRQELYGMPCRVTHTRMGAGRGVLWRAMLSALHISARATAQLVAGFWRAMSFLISSSAPRSTTRLALATACHGVGDGRSAPGDAPGKLVVPRRFWRVMSCSFRISLSGNALQFMLDTFYMTCAMLKACEMA